MNSSIQTYNRMCTICANGNILYYMYKYIHTYCRINSFKVD